LLEEGVGGGRDGRRVARRDQGVGRQVSVPEGQAGGEGGALALAAGRGDGAAVQLDELLDQGQADSAALVRAGPDVLDAVEPLEQAGYLVLGDADASFGHRENTLGAP